MTHLVLVSCPGVGHVKPLLALAEDFVKTNEFVIATVFGILTEDQLCKITVDQLPTGVRFHALIDNVPRMPFDPHYEEFASQYVTDMMAYLDSQELPPPACHIFDMFAGWSRLFAQTCKIPTFLFMPCSLRVCTSSCVLAADSDGSVSSQESDVVHITKTETVLKSDLPMKPEMRVQFSNLISKWKASDGILVNDVEELSSTELIEKMSAFGTHHSLPIYNVGPVGIDPTFTPSESISSDSCIEWLNNHAPSTVVYVALGSWCELPGQDVCELAFALKALDIPVLWAYRGVNSEANKAMWISNREQIDPAEADGLPANFRASLDPNKFRIVPWVDQKRVLQHPSLAMFLSHCGWNSLLEAVSLMGKPIAALPVGAEQGCNAHEVSEHWKIGKRLWLSRPDRKLDRRELEQVLRDLIYTEEYRVNAKKLQSIIVQANSPTGSSHRNLQKFLSGLV
eukprot:Gregarina_sp_Pseudo_9__4070@NODE_420_length_2871_cov_3386_660664_g397_i0_p1_GENE_NODE_420_length_2871_cov_3386_660664_g397_i0NODE_420_length_2871_cov_3386_660664_g397_i0_p1_ORF_typecomplete_len454_score34_16UDPGT/PF00201_18/4_9e39Glyco_tran_28_C/PF04101_16/0_041ProNT_NN/PF07421_11/0_21_NODE_420_length_2871_cov_3386_660664_g397_i012812642